MPSFRVPALSLPWRLAGLDIPAAVAASSVAALVFRSLRKLWLPHPPGTFVPPVLAGGFEGFYKQHWADYFTDGHHDPIGYVKRVSKGRCTQPVGVRVYFNQRVWVANPEDVAQVLGTSLFVKGKLNVALQRMFGFALLTLTDEETHAAHRRALNPAFAPAALRDVANGLLRASAVEALREFRDAAASGSPVDALDFASRVARKNAVSVAFRCRDDATASRLSDLYSKLSLWVHPALLLLPDWLILKFPVDAETREARRGVAAWVTEQTESVRSRTGSTRDSGDKEHVIFDTLVKCDTFTVQNITDHAVTIVLAAADTVLTNFTWQLGVLAQHPRVQTKLYEELVGVFALDTTPDVAELARCPYLTMVIKEVLRLYPPAVLLPRVASKDTILAGSKVFIPAGTVVVANIHGCHRAEETWGADAEEFRPERWGETQTIEMLAARRGAFVPFSLGKRGCIGRDFAMHELTMLVATIVRSFELSFSDGGPLPPAVLPGTFLPLKKISLAVRPRAE